ncbi:MFS transporter [Chloroflexota bacterium]
MNTEIVSKYRWVIMGVIWSAYIIVYVHRLSIGPLSPFLKAEWGLNSTQIGGLVSAATIGSMASAMPAGWWTDRFGIRRMLLIGEIISGIFMLVMYLTPSYQMALILMGCTGFGAGFLMPSTTKGVLVWFPRRERALVMGVKQTSVNAGGMLSAAILPTLALAMGWRFGFLIIGAVAISIGIISYVLYKDPPLANQSTPNENSNSTSTSTSSSVPSLREFLKARDIWLVCLGTFCLIAVEFAVLAHLVLYLTEDLLFPVVTAGVLLALTESGGIVGKPLSGIVSDRIFGSSRKIVFMIWAGVACAACLALAFFGSSLSWGLYPVLFAFGVCGIGFGGLGLTLVGELSGIELAGRVTAINSLIANAGIATGPLLFGYIVDTSGYYPAWLLCAALAAVCMIAIRFVREERRRM